MEKRYQIFISSTFTDLREERKEIIQSLLSAKYIPAGMEMFSASNNEQFKYIKKIIDNCDYYVLIIAARYGSINPDTGISFTEQEYDYAINKNIPVLVFLHDDPFNLPKEKRDDENRELLIQFRDKVSKSRRLCKMWKSPSELVSNVIISLSQEVDENPQQGWMRGSSQDSTELLIQLNDLRIKNESYEKEISRLKSLAMESNFKIENLASGTDTYIIKGKQQETIQTAFGPENVYYDLEMEVSWDEIFSIVGPYLYSYLELNSFTSYLMNGLNSKYMNEFYSLNSDCVQTIKIQLDALNLIEIETKAAREIIKLSEFGKNYLTQLKSIKK